MTNSSHLLSSSILKFDFTYRVAPESKYCGFTCDMLDLQARHDMQNIL